MQLLVLFSILQPSILINVLNQKCYLCISWCMKGSRHTAGVEEAVVVGKLLE
jgi:hypothetical protein